MPFLRNTTVRNRMLKVLVVLGLISPLFESVIGGVFYTSKNGRHFYVENNIEVNWFEAIRLCYEKNMTLITPDTAEKQKEISEIRGSFQALQRLWTTGIEVTNLNYIWITTGKNLTYINWNTAEPSRQGDHDTQCIGIYEDKWSSYRCTGNRNFICEENSFGQKTSQSDSCKCETENKEIVEYKTKLQACDAGAPNKYTQEISILQTENAKMHYQLLLANKTLELKVQENEILTKFHQKEIQLLEEKQKLALSVAINNASNPSRNYNVSLNQYGNHN